MSMNIKYLGVIAEKANIANETLSYPQIEVDTLIKDLELKYEWLKNINYKVAVNQSIVTENILINSNDEIALLPPYSGG